MTPTLRATATATLLALVSVPSCQVQPPDDKGDTAEACTDPSVIGSADLAITLGSTAEVSATGTVCLADEEAVLQWTMESAPVDSALSTSDLDLTDPSAPTFLPDVVGTYVVSVTAVDSAGNDSAADYIVVTVASGNAAPVADCGENVDASVDQRVQLDGSESTDPEGAALEYDWVLSSVPDCSGLTAASLFNSDTVAPSVVPDCPGVFVVGLSVSDSSNRSPADFCSITVASRDQVPVADAGDSGVLSPCTERNFELNGYGSYDPEGASLTYAWSLLSAPTGSTGTFDDPSLPNPTFRWDSAGTYTFELRVYDGTTWSPPDIVSVTFTSEVENSSPIANAGADQTITVAAACDTASYIFTCEDCPSETVLLDGTASDDPVDGDDLAFLWTEVTGELSIEARYSPVTNVTTPSFPSVYNVATVRTWDLVLSASDCADSDSDTVTVTYTCTGEYAP